MAPCAVARGGRATCTISLDPIAWKSTGRDVVSLSMPRARIKGTRRSTGEDAAALIAGEGTPETIAEILDRQGLAVAAFDCTDALLEEERARNFAVIVVCIDATTASLPGLIEPLTQRFPRVPVIVVCSSIQRRAVRAALASGAAGVVLHDDLEYALGACLQAVRAGQVCLPRRSWQQIEPPVLSSREKQVLGLVVMGYMNSQIAEQLFLAESTIKGHLSSAFEKLGVRSRHEAAARILDPQGGLGVGILALGGQPLEAVVSEPG
jgi:DNA-binding NarL/FixJ family response regulator